MKPVTLEEVNRFLVRKDLSAMRFSILACGDPRVIKRFRKNGYASDTMNARMRSFMDEHRHKEIPHPKRNPKPAGLHPPIESTSEKDAKEEIAKGSRLLVEAIFRQHRDIFGKNALKELQAYHAACGY